MNFKAVSLAVLTAAAFAALPPSIQKALAIPAAVTHGTIKDVKHVVILMQENRSFDMYFGTKFGVRGFGDPHPQPTVSGQPVWYQTNGTNASPTTTLPFQILPSENWALAPSYPHAIAQQIQARDTHYEDVGRAILATDPAAASKVE